MAVGAVCCGFDGCIVTGGGVVVVAGVFALPSSIPLAHAVKKDKSFEAGNCLNWFIHWCLYTR